MAETTYFNEPDVQVTDSRIVAPWGVYRPQEVRTVEVETDKGVRRWLYIGVGLIGVLAFIISMVSPFIGQLVNDSVRSVAGIVWGACFFLIYTVLSPRYKVNMRGSFGLVIFDCGDNRGYADRLAQALNSLIQRKERQTESTQERLDG